MCQRDIEDVNDLLYIKDEAVLFDDNLVMSMDLSRGPVQNRDKFCQWLQKAIGKPNQTEMVGLCLHMSEPKPWLGRSQFILFMEFIKIVVRVVFGIEFPQECCAVEMVTVCYMEKLGEQAACSVSMAWWWLDSLLQEMIARAHLGGIRA